MSWLTINSSLSQGIGTYGYAVTFALGLIGHSCSLLTFSQRELRSTSTTFLFFAITISDVFYLFMSLYDFLLTNLGLPQLSPYYMSICRFRTFILNFAQTTSAWLLVCVAFDRLIRASLPHRTRQWCTKRNVIIAILITIICSVALNSHVLQPSFGAAVPFTHVICSPSVENVTSYTIFYYFSWSVLQICINILLPALLMILCLFGIYRKVYNVAVVRHTQHIQKQMLLLMLSKTILFLVCTLSYGTYRLVLIYSLSQSQTESSSTFSIVIALLTILLNSNYSLAFYVHCLTSTLFRKTFLKTIKNCIRRQQRQLRIHPGISNGTAAIAR